MATKNKTTSTRKINTVKCSECSESLRGFTDSEKAAQLHVSCRQRAAAAKAWIKRRAA